MKLPELPCDVGCADRDLTAQILMRMMPGKRRFVDRLPKAAEFGDEYVLKSRLLHLYFTDRKPGRFQLFFRDAFRRIRVMHQKVQPVAEALYVKDLIPRPDRPRKNPLGLRQICRAQFQPLRVQPCSQLRWGAHLLNHPLIHQGHPVASLRFIHIWRRDKNRQSVCCQVSERVPEFAPRYGVHSCRRLIQQQDARLWHQRTDERQFLLHPAAQFPRQPIRETVHVEHLQIMLASLGDLVGSNSAQVADVADILRNRKIRIETERLGEVAGLRARRASRLAKNFGNAAAGFHDPCQDLERRGFACPVGPDQAEDLPIENV